MASGDFPVASPLALERAGGGGGWAGALRALTRAPAPGAGGLRERAWLAARAVRATLLQHAPAAEQLEHTAEFMDARHGATHGIDALQAQRELLALVQEQERQKLEQPLRDAPALGSDGSALLATSSQQFESSWAALECSSEPDGAAGQRQVQTPQLPPTPPSPPRPPLPHKHQHQHRHQQALLEQYSPGQASAMRRRVVDEWALVMVGGIPSQQAGGEVAAVNVQEELEVVGSAPALLRLCSQDPLESRKSGDRPISLKLRRQLDSIKLDGEDLDQVIGFVRTSTRFAPAPNVEPLWEEMSKMLDLSVRKNRTGSAKNELCAAIAIKRLYLMAMVEGCVSVLGSELKGVLEDAEAERSEENFVPKTQFLQEQDRRTSADLVPKVRQLENALTTWFADKSTLTAEAAARIAARLDVSNDDVEFCLARLVTVGRVRLRKRARS
jgi:hypothetical protein